MFKLELTLKLDEDNPRNGKPVLIYTADLTVVEEDDYRLIACPCGSFDVKESMEDIKKQLEKGTSS